MTAYVRRLNPNTSFDSICTKCYMTVASAENEVELLHPESNHVCDPYGEFSVTRLKASHRPVLITGGEMRPSPLCRLRGPQ
jgi:hypothetical protein